jgi:hypothetical protein
MRKLVILTLTCLLQWHFAGCQGVKKGLAPDAYQKLTVVTADEQRTFQIPQHFNGYNAQMMRGPSWNETEFLNRVQQLHPKLIRYPGGTVTSYWDWRTGWLKEGIPLKGDWKSIKKNPIRLEDIKMACDSTGAVPVLVLNMMTSTLEDQLEMLRHARKIKLPVLYVELDNEIYIGDPFYVKKFATGVEYANECNRWIIAIKKEFPGVQVGVIGYSARENQGKNNKPHFARTNSWNRDVLSAIKDADAMTFHVYGGTGLGFLMRTGFSSVDEDDGQPAKMQQAFDSENSVPVVLGVPMQRWRQTNTYDYAIVPQGMKVWITEYNLFEREGVVAGTWAHGLYALMQSLFFMLDSKTELICYHNLTTSAQFAAIFNNDQGFAKAFRKKSNKPFQFTAAGHNMAYFGEALSKGETAVKLKFTVNEPLQGARGFQFPSLEGWLIKGEEHKVIMVNLSDEMITADVSRLFNGLPAFRQTSAMPRMQVASERDVNITSGREEKIKLAPYSVTIIEGEKSE